MQNPIPFGRYELLERVAMGGMAEVFRARAIGREGFSKEVCIKRILPQFCEDEAFVRMFIDEARLAARLQHANIVQIFDFDQVDGSFYIAMEFVHGRDLRAVLRQCSAQGILLNPASAAFICGEMCKGLHYAHRCEGLSLVHRDVSPHNVLVGMNGEVKVMDFGIAKAADRVTHTGTGLIKGKIAYMAPEQAAGREIDHRADQFAAGLVLYEMLTGKRAYDGPEPVALRLALSADVQPPSLVVPTIAPELDEIFLKSTAKNPNDRFPDMRAMERALTQHLYRLAPEDEALDIAGMMQRLFGVRKAEPTRPLMAAFTGDAVPNTRTAPLDIGAGAADPAEGSGMSQSLASQAGLPEINPSAPTSLHASQPSQLSAVTNTTALLENPEPLPCAPTRTNLSSPATELPAPDPADEASVETTVRVRSARRPLGLSLGVMVGMGALLIAGSAGITLAWRWSASSHAPAPPPKPADLPVVSLSGPPAVSTGAVADVAVAPPAHSGAQASSGVPAASSATIVAEGNRTRPERKKQDDGEEEGGGKGSHADGPKLGKGMGRLHLTVADGWAEVWIKDTRLGETPVDMPWPAGRHLVTFKNEEKNLNESIVVILKPGGSFQKTYKWKRAPPRQ